MLAVSSFLLFSALHLNSSEASVTRLDLISTRVFWHFNFALAKRNSVFRCFRNKLVAFSFISRA